jgi:hypothetical protein
MTLNLLTGIFISLLFVSLSACGKDVASMPDEHWVGAISVKDRLWSAQLCSDYLVTVACGGAGSKGFDNKGQLPDVISVGDTITYSDINGKEFSFTVQNISLYTYSKDLDEVYQGVRYTAKKGETSCTLYDERSRSKIISSEGNYLSTIRVKNCQELAKS